MRVLITCYFRMSPREQSFTLVSGGPGQISNSFHDPPNRSEKFRSNHQVGLKNFAAPLTRLKNFVAPQTGLKIFVAPQTGLKNFVAPKIRPGPGGKVKVTTLWSAYPFPYSRLDLPTGARIWLRWWTICRKIFVRRCSGRGRINSLLQIYRKYISQKVK